MNHAERQQQANADYRLFAAAKFEVVERATGKAIPGEPMPHDFACYVRDVKDTFKTGAYFIRGV